MFAQRKSSKNLVERGRLSVLWPTRKPSSCRPESLEPLHVEDRHCTTVVRATLESSQRDVITLCARRSTDDSANSVVQTSQHPCTPSPHQTLPHPSTATFFLRLHEYACATVEGSDNRTLTVLFGRQQPFITIPAPPMATLLLSLPESASTLLVHPYSLQSYSSSTYHLLHGAQCTGDQGPRTFVSRHSTPHPVTLLSHRVEATAW